MTTEMKYNNSVCFSFMEVGYMYMSAVSPVMNAVGDMTLSEKGISSAKVILTGFVVVFAVLVLLICIIKIYSAIVSRAQRSDVRVKKKKSPEKPLPAAAAPAVAEEITPDGDPDHVPEEVVAVIAAAVAVMYGGREKVRIKSVKRSGAKRSAWANAGVLENTRPF